MRPTWKQNTILFITSQTISLFGTMLVQYSIMWHIVLKTQSATMITLYTIVCVLPTFVTSLFGGVWADKYNKKNLINIADGSIAAISLVIALCLMADIDSIVMLLVAGAVRALGQGVQAPVVTAFIPLIVPADKLLKINGYNASIQSAIYILSPIIAASLMSIAPLYTLFFIDVITASIAIAILYFLVKVDKNLNIPVISNEITTNKPIFTDLINGLKYIKTQKWLYRIIILGGLFMIFMAPPAMLTPLQVVRNFGNNLFNLTAIEITWGGGMIIGGMLVGRFYFQNRVLMIGIACIVFAIVAILLGIYTNLVPYLITFVFAGIACTYFNATTMTLLQEKVDSNYLGRVISVFTMLNSIAMPIGILFFGPLGDIISIDSILIITGIVLLILSIIFITNKTLKQAGNPHI